MTFASRNHARVMFWIAVAMCVLATAAVAAAAVLMPANEHGRRGVVTFVRSFGPWLAWWGPLAWWARSEIRDLDREGSAPPPESLR